MLEPRVAQLAAERATEEDFEALERSIEAMRRLVDGGWHQRHEDRFLQLDVQFHLALARAAGNPTVETLMRILFRQLEIARDMAMHVPLDAGVDDRDPRADARRIARRGSRRDRGRDGRAPRPARAHVRGRTGSGGKVT